MSVSATSKPCPSGPAGASKLSDCSAPMFGGLRRAPPPDRCSEFSCGSLTPSARPLAIAWVVRAAHAPTRTARPPSGLRPVSRTGVPRGGGMRGLAMRPSPPSRVRSWAPEKPSSRPPSAYGPTPRPAPRSGPAPTSPRTGAAPSVSPRPARGLVGAGLAPGGLRNSVSRGRGPAHRPPGPAPGGIGPRGALGAASGGAGQVERAGGRAGRWALGPQRALKERL